MPRKKKTSKKTTTTRTRRTAFPPLKSTTSQKQLEALEGAALEFLMNVENTTLVPIGYMRHVFTELFADLRRNLKARRVDPIVRKQERA